MDTHTRSIRSHLAVLAVLLVVSMTAGCLTTGSGLKKEDPPFDRTIVFDRPFDVTFLKTMEALNTFPDWLLQETNKEAGLIILRNQQYGHLFDRDKGIARFAIKRVNRKQTSVELDPSSQDMGKGKVLLDKIKEVMAAGPTGGQTA